MGGRETIVPTPHTRPLANSRGPYHSIGPGDILLPNNVVINLLYVIWMHRSILHIDVKNELSSLARDGWEL